jgi:hypothetical protein
VSSTDRRNTYLGSRSWSEAIGAIRVIVQNYTGRTDSDSGSNADRSGYARTGVSNSDSGAGSDRAGYGRAGHQA